MMFLRLRNLMIDLACVRVISLGIPDTADIPYIRLYPNSVDDKVLQQPKDIVLTDADVEDIRRLFGMHWDTESGTGAALVDPDRMLQARGASGFHGIGYPRGAP